MSLELFDQRGMRHRRLDDSDHQVVELKTREYIEKLIEGYPTATQDLARVFIFWMAGGRQSRLNPPFEGDMERLKKMLASRECAIAPQSMEAIRIYADMIRLASVAAQFRIQMIEGMTLKPFKVITNHRRHLIKDARDRKAAIHRVV